MGVCQGALSPAAPCPGQGDHSAVLPERRAGETAGGPKEEAARAADAAAPERGPVLLGRLLGWGGGAEAAAKEAGDTAQQQGAAAGPTLLGRLFPAGGDGGPEVDGKLKGGEEAVDEDEDEESAADTEAAARSKWVQEQVGWVERRRRDVQAADASAEYRELLEEAKAGVHELAERWDLLYLLVPGLFCNKYPMYMYGTRDHLLTLGLDCRIAKIDTGRSVDENAASLAEIVEVLYAETGKRVVLVGHSKGGCDAVAAVSRHQDAVRGKVAGVVCLQSPLGGTPIADDLLGGKMRGVVSGAIKHVLGGEVDALGDLTYERRQRELEAFPFPHKEVPVVTLSSNTEAATSMLALMAKYMRKKYNGLENDGMVACPDAHLPSSTRVTLHVDWDHGACAFPTLGALEKDELVNEVAMALVARLVPRAAPPRERSLKPVFDFWHGGNKEHTFHFGDPWEGERKNRLAFLAYARPAKGTEPVYDFWHEQRQEHTFHFGEPREGERRNNVAFHAFRKQVTGSEPVFEFWHEDHREHTIHLGDPWEGETRGGVAFYAFRTAPLA